MVKEIKSTGRTRVSERALTVALKAMTESGLTVSKIVLTGSKIEIFCEGTDAAAQEQDDGLEPW